MLGFEEDDENSPSEKKRSQTTPRSSSMYVTPTKKTMMGKRRHVGLRSPSKISDERHIVARLVARQNLENEADHLVEEEATGDISQSPPASPLAVYPMSTMCVEEHTGIEKPSPQHEETSSSKNNDDVDMTSR